MTWTPDKPLDERCPHYNPEAAGYGLHGVCIFCWRDRAATLAGERNILGAKLAIERGYNDGLKAQRDAARDSAARARREALEEAAELVGAGNGYFIDTPRHVLATKIRELAESPTIPAGEPPKEKP